MTTDNPLRSMAERLASVPSFNIHVVKKDKVEPWYEVVGQQIIEDLMIDETNLQQAVVTVSAQLGHWGRLEAQARRVWEIEERHYRVWRDGQALKLCTPPAEGASAWKKPPEHQIEATIRGMAEYTKHQQRMERAEEAYNATRLTREAFLAKRDMLKLCVVRAAPNSAPRLSV